MIEFVMLVCLSFAPDRCESVTMPLADTASLMTCVVGGQQHAAQWISEHPTWLLRRWTCGFPRA